MLAKTSQLLSMPWDMQEFPERAEADCVLQKLWPNIPYLAIFGFPMQMQINTANCAALIAAACTLASCATAPSEAETGPAPVYEFSECPVIDSRGWTAYINAMPGPGAKPTLHISGEVDLPTPGFKVELIAGPADRMMPPGQRFSLAATKPEGMVAQVVTPTAVRYSGPPTYEKYRSITIGCGGKVLAHIENIQTAY